MDYEKDCSICFNEYDDKSYIENCQHSFCFKCIIEWNNKEKSCPMCRVDNITGVKHKITKLGYKIYDFNLRGHRPNENVVQNSGEEAGGQLRDDAYFFRNMSDDSLSEETLLFEDPDLPFVIEELGINREHNVENEDLAFVENIEIGDLDEAAGGGPPSPVFGEDEKASILSYLKKDISRPMTDEEIEIALESKLFDFPDEGEFRMETLTEEEIAFINNTGDYSDNSQAINEDAGPSTASAVLPKENVEDITENKVDAISDNSQAINEDAGPSTASAVLPKENVEDITENKVDAVSDNSQAINEDAGPSTASAVLPKENVEDITENRVDAVSDNSQAINEDAGPSAASAFVPKEDVEDITENKVDAISDNSQAINEDAGPSTASAVLPKENVEDMTENKVDAISNNSYAINEGAGPSSASAVVPKEIVEDKSGNKVEAISMENLSKNAEVPELAARDIQQENIPKDTACAGSSLDESKANSDLIFNENKIAEIHEHIQNHILNTKSANPGLLPTEVIDIVRDMYPTLSEYFDNILLKTDDIETSTSNAEVPISCISNAEDEGAAGIGTNIKNSLADDSTDELPFDNNQPMPLPRYVQLNEPLQPEILNASPIKENYDAEANARCIFDKWMEQNTYSISGENVVQKESEDLIKIDNHQSSIQNKEIADPIQNLENTRANSIFKSKSNSSTPDKKAFRSVPSTSSSQNLSTQKPKMFVILQPSSQSNRSMPNQHNRNSTNNPMYVPIQHPPPYAHMINNTMHPTLQPGLNPDYFSHPNIPNVGPNNNMPQSGAPVQLNPYQTYHGNMAPMAFPGANPSLPLNTNINNVGYNKNVVISPTQSRIIRLSPYGSQIQPRHISPEQFNQIRANTVSSVTAPAIHLGYTVNQNNPNSIDMQRSVPKPRTSVPPHLGLYPTLPQEESFPRQNDITQLESELNKCGSITAEQQRLSEIHHEPAVNTLNFNYANTHPQYNQYLVYQNQLRNQSRLNCHRNRIPIIDPSMTQGNTIPTNYGGYVNNTRFPLPNQIYIPNQAAAPQMFQNQQINSAKNQPKKLSNVEMQKPAMENLPPDNTPYPFSEEETNAMFSYINKNARDAPDHLTDDELNVILKFDKNLETLTNPSTAIQQEPTNINVDESIFSNMEHFTDPKTQTKMVDIIEEQKIIEATIKNQRQIAFNFTDDQIAIIAPYLGQISSYFHHMAYTEDEKIKFISYWIERITNASSNDVLHFNGDEINSALHLRSNSRA